MNTESYKNFIANCKKAVQDDVVLDLNGNNMNVVASEVFSSVEKVKQLASDIRYKFINTIDDSLRAFDKNFSSNGGNIHWCIAYNDFLDKLDKLLTKNKVSKVNLFSSLFAEELGVKSFLTDNDYKIEPESTDCSLFTPQCGIVNTGSLLLHYRSAYEMELIMSSKLKIFILPINDFLFKPEECEIFSHLYSIYSNESDYPYLTSIFTPSPIEKKSDIHLFLIDNGRSNILQNKDIRKALTCIGCGACKKVCPIYNIIGDKPYDNVFTGPIANVILPFIENIENYKHLCFSCTACGNCSAVCPVKIPVSELIVANKNYFFESKMMDIHDIRIAKSLARNLLSRKNMNSKRWIKSLKLKSMLNSKLAEQYNFSKSTFNQQYVKKI